MCRKLTNQLCLWLGRLDTNSAGYRLFRQTSDNRILPKQFLKLAYFNIKKSLIPKNNSGYSAEKHIYAFPAGLSLLYLVDNIRLDNLNFHHLAEYTAQPYHQQI